MSRLSRSSASSSGSGRLSSSTSGCTDPGESHGGRMERISEATVETESGPKATEVPIAPLSGEALLAFLEPYSYVARNSEEWLTGLALPEISLSVTGHSKVQGSTHYDVECSLALRGQWSSPFLSWRARLRLAHLREGLHDPVKQKLGLKEYKTHFGGAPFAHSTITPGYAVPGTTSRLNSWCRRLADALNAGKVPPTMTATVLRTLSVPPMKRALVTSANRVTADEHGSLGRGLAENESFASAPPVFKGSAGSQSNPFSEGAAETNPFGEDVASTPEDLNPFSAKQDDADLNPFSGELNGTVH